MIDKNWPSIVLSKHTLSVDEQGDAPGKEKAQIMDELDNVLDFAIKSQISLVDGVKMWLLKGDGITLFLADPENLSRRHYDIQGSKITVTLQPHHSLFETAAEAILNQQSSMKKDFLKTWRGRWNYLLKMRFYKSSSNRLHQKNLTAQFLANKWIESLHGTLNKK